MTVHGRHIEKLKLVLFSHPMGYYNQEKFVLVFSTSISYPLTRDKHKILLIKFLTNIFHRLHRQWSWICVLPFFYKNTEVQFYCLDTIYWQAFCNCHLKQELSSAMNLGNSALALIKPMFFSLLLKQIHFHVLPYCFWY